MRLARKKLVTCGIVVLYGGISLLGYGLHWLSPADHHHHHHRHVVQAGGHHHPHAGLAAHASHHSHVAHAPDAHDADHHCDQHDHDRCAGDQHTHGDDALSVSAAGALAHWHACDICAFLDQVKSQSPHVAAAVEWQPVVIAVPPLTQPPISTVALTIHAPRGPPALL